METEKTIWVVEAQLSYGDSVDVFDTRKMAFEYAKALREDGQIKFHITNQYEDHTKTVFNLGCWYIMIHECPLHSKPQ